MGTTRKPKTTRTASAQPQAIVRKAVAPTIIARQACDYTPLPPVRCQHEASSDTPDDMKKHLEDADKHFEALSHLVKDGGRLNHLAFFLLASLPDGQMDEFVNRLCDLSDADFDLALQHLVTGTEHVNFAWMPQWAATVFPNETDQDKERKIRFLNEFAAPRLEQFEVHFADTLCAYEREQVVPYIDFFMKKECPIEAVMQFTEGCAALNDDECVALLTREGHTSDTLSRTLEMMQSDQDKAAVQMLNMNVIEGE